MNHPWFSTIDWDKLLKKEIKGELQVKLLPTDDMTQIAHSHNNDTNFQVEGFSWTDHKVDD